MIETKVIEIRDSGTFIPAMVIRVQAGDGDDSYLLRRAGWSSGPGIYLMHMNLCTCQFDPYDWKDGSRTMRVAHEFVKKSNFDTLKNGDVVDVEYILGETDAPKMSERVGYPL